MKTDELRAMSVDELKRKEKELSVQLLDLRLQRASQQLKNPLLKRWAKRDIARVLTVIREKQK